MGLSSKFLFTLLYLFFVKNPTCMRVLFCFYLKKVDFPPATLQASSPANIHTVALTIFVALSEYLQVQIDTSNGSHYSILIQVLWYAYVYSCGKYLCNRTLFPNTT